MRSATHDCSLLLPVFSTHFGPKNSLALEVVTFATCSGGTCKEQAHTGKTLSRKSMILLHVCVCLCVCVVSYYYLLQQLQCSVVGSVHTYSWGKLSFQMLDMDESHEISVVSRFQQPAFMHSAIARQTAGMLQGSFFPRFRARP